MNKEKLINQYEKMKANKKRLTSVDLILKDLQSLDEPEPLPFKLKDVVGRIRGFDPTTQTRWLNDILKELGGDYGLMKYREGYEQGKLEGEWVGNQLKDADKIRQELNKVTIPQFVADAIEDARERSSELEKAFQYAWWSESDEFTEWYRKKSNRDVFARAWLDGYEVDKEKRYRIKLKSNSKEIDYLVNTDRNGLRFYSSIYTQRREHTHKELEEAGFGWVFDCPGIEIEEVKDE